RIEFADQPAGASVSAQCRSAEAAASQFPEPLLRQRDGLGIASIELVARIAEVVHHDLDALRAASAALLLLHPFRCFPNRGHDRPLRGKAVHLPSLCGSWTDYWQRPRILSPERRAVRPFVSSGRTRHHRRILLRLTGGRHRAGPRRCPCWLPRRRYAPCG